MQTFLHGFRKVARGRIVFKVVPSKEFRVEPFDLPAFTTDTVWAAGWLRVPFLAFLCNGTLDALVCVVLMVVVGACGQVGKVRQDIYEKLVASNAGISINSLVRCRSALPPRVCL